MFTTSTMALPTPLVATLLFSIFSTLASAQTDNANGCTCFRTNGSASGYFTSHRFFDYRNIASSQAAVPDVVTGLDNTTNALASSNFFMADAWTNDWSVQNWTNSDSMAGSDATTLMANSPNNVYIEKSNDSDPSYSTYLTLRTSRQQDFQSAAEINSVEKNFQYLSARFYARVTGSPGACAGMFTYLAPKKNKPETVQEADIEILTSGPRNKVQYTNQPSVDKKGNALDEATVNSTNPGNRDWSQWNVYRLDWIPKLSEWYVNGESVASIKFQAPKDPAGLLINMWSDGGSWTGNMSLFDEAYLQIQWMEVVYNTSGPLEGISKRGAVDEVGFAGPLVKRKGKKGCKVVCGIDEKVTDTGTPAVLINNTAAAPCGWKGEGMGSMVLLPLLLVGGAVFGLL